MPTSKLKMLAKLYSKDMRELLPEVIVVVVAAILLNGYFYWRAAQMPNLAIAPAVSIMPSFLIMGLAGFLPFISSFKLLSREWSNNTVYQIMSLPVSGTMIMGSKILALVTQYLIGTVIAAFSAILAAWKYLPEIFQGFSQVIQVQPDFFNIVFLFYLIGLSFLIYLISISFLSQIVGKLYARFSGLITALVFLATLYIMGKITAYMALGLNMEPVLGSTSTNLNLSSLEGNLVIILAAAALIFTLAVLVYNTRVEL